MAGAKLLSPRQRDWHRPGTHQRRSSSTPPWHCHAQAGLERSEDYEIWNGVGQGILQDGGGCFAMNNRTAPTLANYEKALHKMLDENEALQAEIVKLKEELSTLISWINGDA